MALQRREFGTHTPHVGLGRYRLHHRAAWDSYGIEMPYQVKQLLNMFAVAISFGTGVMTPPAVWAVNTRG